MWRKSAGSHDKVNVLITVPFEPSCEMSKWALDYFNVEYKEEKYVPVIHVVPVLYATRGITKTIIKTTNRSGKHWRTNYSVPVLLTKQHNIVHDAPQIMQFVNGCYSNKENTLYKSDFVFTLQKRFCKIGEHATRIALFFMLRDRLVFNKYLRLNFETQTIQTTIISLFYKRIKSVLNWNMRLNRDVINKSIEKVKDELLFVESLLSDGRKFLTGDEMTAADIAFSCMLSPVLCIQSAEGFSAALPHVDEVDDEFRHLVNACRDCVAGKFALWMFKEHRQSKARSYHNNDFIKSKL
ncbi:hypothetical protein AKO1_010487 [Acrasis kona]|uniref:Glutathione S-transferase C-terminal domain-containing protein n=1 Tax=Acrasis kona TaxID=1008807 RepID=A0AAW2ZKH8_9EUKA